MTIPGAALRYCPASNDPCPGNGQWTPKVYALSDPIETLLSSAEISAALLGTVAIVSVFRGGERRWRPEGRFWVMVVLASSTFGLALLPIPFIAAEASPSMTWSIPALFVVASTIGVTRLSF